MKTKLEVGDIVYAVNAWGNIVARFVIARTTKTQAISEDGYKFKIDIWRSGTISFIGKTYGSRTFLLATPELDAKYEHQFLQSEFARIENYKLTTDQLKRILEIAKEGQGNELPKNN